MAWVIPVTDRTEGARCTPDDLNRIASDINYLQGSSLKDDFTNDDIVTLEQWTAMMNGVADCCLKYGVKMETPVSLATTYANFNQAETYLSICYTVKEQIRILKEGTMFVGNTGATVNAPTIQAKGVF